MQHQDYPTAPNDSLELDQIVRYAALLAEGTNVCDVAVLAALCGSEAVAHLLAAGAAWRTPVGIVLTEKAQARALQQLEAEPTQAIALHAAIGSYYTALLPQPGAAQTSALALSHELAYMHHLTRRCELVLQLQPAELADAVADAPLELLADPAHRHLLRYYQALGAGLRDQIAAARAALSALLAETALSDGVRGRALNSAAVFARQQGDYEAALAGYRASQAIWERLGNTTRHGLALLNQGILHYELQEYAEAEADLRAALTLFEASAADVHAGSAHNELGLVYRDQGRWDAARYHFAACATIWKREGASERLGFVTINEAELALLEGRYQQARIGFEGALALVGEQPNAVEVYINMGLLAQAQGDDAAAVEQYTQALALSERVGYGERLALIQYRIGHAHARMGAGPAARAAFAAAVAAVEARRTPLRDEGLLISLMGRWQQLYEAQVLQLLAEGDVSGAFAATERARARAFADLLARNRPPTADSRQPSFGVHRRRSALGARRSALGARRSAVSGACVPQPSCFRPGARQRSAFSVQRSALLSYFCTGLRGSEQALLAQLPPEAAGLRACLDTPARLLCFAVTPGQLRVEHCQIDPNLLLASSPRRADGRRFLQPAILRQLYDSLIAPQLPLLEQSAELVIVPHGPLHQVPFAALLNPAGVPLLELVPRISYTPSATIWRRARDIHTRAELAPLLAIGYDGAGEGRLRHTEAEARAVATLSGGDMWQGEPGISERLLAVGGNYRLLHIACHGTFNLAEPLSSALHLAPGEQLTAAQVLARLRLRAELVTLSACSSGVNKLLRGDEPLGLVRAFMAAGAASVLVTLWPVEDASARLLMERLYAALLHDHLPPPAALQAAQRYLRNLTPEEVAAVLPDAPELNWNDPTIWAAYVVIG